jgi:hypothetical protein
MLSLCSAANSPCKERLLAPSSARSLFVVKPRIHSSDAHETDQEDQVASRDFEIDAIEKARREMA